MLTLFLTLAFVALLFGRREASLFTKDRSAFFKAILPIFIMLHHFSQKIGGLSDMLLVGAYAVGLFFFVSGYGMESKRESSPTTMRYILKRVRCVVVPVIIPALVYVLCGYMLEGVSPLDSVLQCLYRFECLVPNNWFAFTLILLYFFFYLSALLSGALMPRCRYGSAIVLSFFILAFMLLFHVLDCPYYTYSTAMAFLSGIVYAQNEESIKKWATSWRLAVVLLLHLIVVFQLSPVGGRVIGVFVLSITSALLFCKIPVPECKVVSFLSTISYQMFLCHGIVIYALQVLGPTDIASALCLLFVFTIPLAWLCTKATEAIERVFGW